MVELVDKVPSLIPETDRFDDLEVPHWLTQMNSNLNAVFYFMKALLVGTWLL